MCTLMGAQMEQAHQQPLQCNEILAS
jgi:hypothetical protein